ncbi:hypothetical protein RhiirC2_786547 [Rhizophagus irregularis]|uniref:Uncharacterized protein n=1 Tax=Rhizophagus irregularis TaxID=588596 RepID=A0A2N1MU32_9GLOM|nr:hypothetical protein RhiirC2_786547 [Rhizophagus irregularis]
MAYQRTILPLYYNPGLSPCSRTVWFLTGFLFVLDFYKSETGQRIVRYIKKLYNNYSDFCSIRNLEELMGRGNHMIPSLFIWIFQEYPESAGRQVHEKISALDFRVMIRQVRIFRILVFCNVDSDGFHE